MGLFDRPRTLPPILQAIYGCLVRFPEEDWTTERLADLLVRPVLKSGESPAKVDVFAHSLRFGAEIGLFEERERDVWAVAGLVGDLPVLGDLGSFRKLVRELIMPKPSKLTDEKRLPAADFVDALSWFLLQNAYGSPLRWMRDNHAQGAQELLQAQVSNQDQWFVKNDIQWGAFSRWCLFLGFCKREPPLASDGGTRGAFGIRPDPTEVVREALRTSLGTSQSQPLVEFRATLVERWGVLDGGQYQARLITSLRKEIRPIAQRLTPALSLALLRLDANREIHLENRADAASRLELSIGGGGGILFSHIRADGGKAS